MTRKQFIGLAVVALMCSNAATAAPIVSITEWSYDSLPGEWMEFTNTSNAPVDMTDWSQDDNDRHAGTHAFGTTFGIVQPGESVVVTETAEATFRTAWNLPASVKVWAGATGTGYSNDNLGRSDEINLYDSTGSLIDQLTYNDQGTGNVHGPRTQNVSGNIPFAALGLNNASLAVASTVGDTFHSYSNSSSNVGNPGQYSSVPEPTSLALIAIGTLIGTLRRRAH
jgi:hypothetical protein